MSFSKVVVTFLGRETSKCKGPEAGACLILTEEKYSVPETLCETRIIGDGVRQGTVRIRE